jgi:hypothetical protein
MRAASVVAVGGVVLARDARGAVAVVVVRRGRAPQTGVRETEVVQLEREGFAYAIHEHLCTVDEAAEVGVLPRLVPGDDAADARWARLGELAGLGVDDQARAVILRAADVFGRMAVP